MTDTLDRAHRVLGVAHLWAAAARAVPATAERLARLTLPLALTPKLDGCRTFLVIERPWLLTCVSGKPAHLAPYDGPPGLHVLDAEQLPDGRCFVFDVLCAAGKDVRAFPLFDRLAAGESAAPATQQWTYKPYLVSATPATLVLDLLTAPPMTPTDGLVIVEPLAPYGAAPLKFKEVATIDVTVGPQRELLVLGPDGLTPLRWRERTPRCEAAPAGAVVEVQVPGGRGGPVLWPVLRLRPDRLHPNRWEVARELLTLVAEGWNRRAWLVGALPRTLPPLRLLLARYLAAVRRVILAAVVEGLRDIGITDNAMLVQELDVAPSAPVLAAYAAELRLQRVAEGGLALGSLGGEMWPTELKGLESKGTGLLYGLTRGLPSLGTWDTKVLGLPRWPLDVGLAHATGPLRAWIARKKP